MRERGRQVAWEPSSPERPGPGDSKPAETTPAALGSEELSVLFDRPALGRAEPVKSAETAWLKDLNLDQFVAALTAGRDEHYDLAHHLSSPLDDVGTVRYRQAILAELDDASVADPVKSFCEGMEGVRGLLKGTRRFEHRYYREGWLLEAASRYVEGVSRLSEQLGELPLESSGLTKLRDHLASYCCGEPFSTLASEVAAVRRGLQAVEYTTAIRGNRVTVSRYEGEQDYSKEVLATFAKFSQGAEQDHRVRLPELVMNHVQAHVLELVARLFPAAFSALDRFYSHHHDFFDPVLERFDREVRFYLAYLDYIKALRANGLSFCIPEVDEQPSEVAAEEAFDIVLADERLRTAASVVCNDFSLHHRERLLVVTGPNQGGKTTFARAFGQLHYLASLGLYVPAKRASLVLPDQIFTLFERAEEIATLRGKLEEELVRARSILRRATARSIVIMNETFSSTTLEDSELLGRRVLEQLCDIGVHGVYVTFIDDLSALNEATVSMVASVDPDDPTVRTFKIVRRAADGLTYAAALAAKYGLTYEMVRKTLSP